MASTGREPRLRRSMAVAVLVWGCLCGRPAHAQESAEAAADSVTRQARQLFRDGVELSQQERWSEAEQRFRQSYANVPRSNTAFNWALALLHLERGKEALDVLAELQRLPGEKHPVSSAAISRMRTRALALVARMTLQVTPPTASVALDGQPTEVTGPVRELVLEPGSHDLRIRAPGYEALRMEVTADAGSQMSRTVALQAAQKVDVPPAAPHPHTRVERVAQPRPPMHRAQPPSSPGWLSIAAMGTGASLLVAGGVTGVLALRENAAFKERCPDIDRCDAAARPELEPVQERVERLSVATDALLLTGAALAGTGLVLWLVGASQSADATVDRRAGLTFDLAPAGARLRW